MLLLKSQRICPRAAWSGLRDELVAANEAIETERLFVAAAR
jgi:hypothetical protein